MDETFIRAGFVIDATLLAALLPEPSLEADATDHRLWHGLRPCHNSDWTSALFLPGCGPESSRGLSVLALGIGASLLGGLSFVPHLAATIRTRPLLVSALGRADSDAGADKDRPKDAPLTPQGDSKANGCESRCPVAAVAFVGA